MRRSWPAAQFLVPSVPTGFEPHAVSCWGGSRSVPRGEWLDENFSMARSMVGFDEVFGGRIKSTHPATASVQVRGRTSGRISSWIVYTSECIDMAFGGILADYRGLCVSVLRCSAGSPFACTPPIRAGVVGVIACARWRVSGAGRDECVRSVRIASATWPRGRVLLSRCRNRYDNVARHGVPIRAFFRQ